MKQYNRTEMRRRHLDDLEVRMRVQSIWSAPRQIWDTGMIGASAEKAIVQVRHLQGGNQRYQPWVIMGKHTRDDRDQG